MLNTSFNNMPLVSVALCTFNGEQFLNKQLESILRQTYANLEIVIVDDCSTDQTATIVSKYQEKDQRVKYVRNETNLGFNKNFEKAVKLCSGEFIAISDQDDIWIDSKIERLLDTIGDHLMVYANSAIIDDKDQRTGKLMIDQDRPEEDYRNFKSILINNFVSGHNLLFRKEALSYVLPFPKVGFYDWWMGFVMLYENNLAYCNEVLTLYRVHEASVTNSLPVKSIKKKVDIMKKECETIIEELSIFQTYSRLKFTDAKFLKTLKHGIYEKLRWYFSPTLFRFLSSNFKSVYPGYKKGKYKTIAFSYRLSRGIKLHQLLGK